jgi:hypothetical protein
MTIRFGMQVDSSILDNMSKEDVKLQIDLWRKYRQINGFEYKRLINRYYE